VRVHFVVVLECGAQLTHHGERIAAVHAFDVIALKRLHKRFCHPVRLWTLNGRGQRFQADLARKRVRVACNVRRTVIAQPCNGRRRNSVAKASFNRSTIKSSTVRYFGIEIDDALEVAEQTEV